MATTRIFVGLQLLLTVFLVVLLWSLYSRLRKQDFFRWWACAWTSFAGYLGIGAVALHLAPGWTFLRGCLVLASLVCGYLEVPFLVLGACTLRDPENPPRASARAGIGAAFAASILIFAASLYVRNDPRVSFALRTGPRTLALAAGLFFCAWVFIRQWRKYQSTAALVTGGFCSLYAVDQSFYTLIYLNQIATVWSPSLLPLPFSLLLSPLPFFADLISGFGICLGVVLLLVEEHHRTERALLKSYAYGQTISESNVALLSEIQDRQRAEGALRDSEDRYRDLVEHSQDLLCIHDLQGKLLSVNPAPARILGYEVPELLGIPMRDIIAPEFREQFDEYLARVQRNGTDAGLMAVVTRTGERRIWEYHNTLRTEGVLSPIIRGMAHDVTERMRAERALRDSEERFRKLVEALPDAIYVHSKDRIVFVNPACVKLLGAQDPEQLMGKDIVEIIPPDDLAATRHRIQRCSETGTASSATESLLLALDGTPIQIEAAEIPITWKWSPAIEVVAHDIRERKRAEQTVQEWQKRVELAQKAGLLIGLWEWDIAANTLLWSEETYRLLGYTRETFTGKGQDFLRRLHPEDRSRMEAAIQKVADGGSEFEAQFRVMRPDGSISWLDTRGVIIRHEPTRVMMGIVIDVTDLRTSQQSLEEAKRELAHVTRISSMGELTASIAHEINQPLGAIATDGSATLNWLAMRPPNLAEAREAAKRVIREANRASDVIARIRSLLKKAPPELRSVDANVLIEEVLALLGNELTSAGVVVRTELAADGLALLGDRVQLQQVILNLIMNAIDAMNAITDRPRELLIKSARNHEGMLVQVHDSGVGLDPEKAELIFQPFFTTKPQGIGMGLSISRSIVEAHGGRLWATPGSPHGAILQFTLPKAGDVS